MASCLEKTRDTAVEARELTFGLTTMVAPPLATLCALVCAVAFLIILDNYVTSVTKGLFVDNVPVLKPGVVNALWMTAKWSGVIGGGALALWGLSFGLFSIPCDKHRLA